MQTQLDSGQAIVGLEKFLKVLGDGRVEVSLAKDISALAASGKARLAAGDVAAADSSVSSALLAVKRSLGTEIGLRQGFELSSMLVEDVRRHIAQPAVLFADAADFAATFFRIYADSDYRQSGLPHYLMQRPYPKTPKAAAAALLEVIEGFGLPAEKATLLKADIDAMARHASAFSKGKASPAALHTQDVLLLSLTFTLMDMRGSYLTEHQVMTVLGLVIFAVPAWLCAAPPAWLAQLIIAVIGILAYGIYVLLEHAETQRAYVNVWVSVMSCTLTVAAALALLGTETAGLDADQKKDLKDALQSTLAEVQAGKIPTTGRRVLVVRKLRALIAAL